MNIKHIIFVTAALVCSATLATDTTFTYQGRLDQGGQPHTGSPAMRFLLFTTETGGSALGEVNKGSVTVTDGLFQVDLDFGSKRLRTSTLLNALLINILTPSVSKMEHRYEQTLSQGRAVAITD